MSAPRAWCTSLATLVTSLMARMRSTGSAMSVRSAVNMFDTLLARYSIRGWPARVDTGAQGVEDQRRVRRRRLAAPFVGRGCDGLGRRVGIGEHDAGQHLGRGDAVGHAVVDLGDETDVAILEPFDDPQLPQRPAAIE